MEQYTAEGVLADLGPGDMIIVWDEDTSHASDERFTFSGTYIADPDCDYVKLSTTDSRTDCAIYTVTGSGTLTVTDASDSEHEAFRLNRNLLDFEKTDDVSDNELAFYDALANNQSAIEVLGDEKLRDLARVLVERVKANTSIDWTIKENVRAKLRVVVKRLLRQYGYPPDKQLLATENVLKQAELLADEWAA